MKVKGTGVELDFTHKKDDSLSIRDEDKGLKRGSMAVERTLTMTIQRSSIVYSKSKRLRMVW